MIQWVPYSKERLRREARKGPIHIAAGAIAFAGSNYVGEVYCFEDRVHWYGYFDALWQDRIGSCESEAQARANIEHRWKETLATAEG